MSDKEYYLCSEAVIKAFPDAERSKPFKSGYSFDAKTNYYVAVLDYEKAATYYATLPKENDFWLWECSPGTMDVSELTKAGMKRSGIFAEMENVIGLTKDNNRAMTIRNMADKFGQNPIEFINSIA